MSCTKPSVTTGRAAGAGSGRRRLPQGAARLEPPQVNGDVVGLQLVHDSDLEFVWVRALVHMRSLE
jgi:hypothetical protein